MKGWFGKEMVLLYKRLNVGGFSWPRTKEEAMEATPKQYRMLMQGLEIVARRPIGN
ncbi:MAG: IS66 family insertion sequence element accessory protein TnpB [[Clostridium] scindens]